MTKRLQLLIEKHFDDLILAKQREANVITSEFYDEKFGPAVKAKQKLIDAQNKILTEVNAALKPIRHDTGTRFSMEQNCLTCIDAKAYNLNKGFSFYWDLKAMRKEIPALDKIAGEIDSLELRKRTFFVDLELIGKKELSEKLKAEGIMSITPT